VRTPSFPFLDEDVEVRPQELSMAGSLIDTLTGDFDPSQFKDDYREALQAVIDAKIEGHEVVAPGPAQEEPGAVVDLMAALRASVEAARKGRPGGGMEDGSATSESASAGGGSAEGGSAEGGSADGGKRASRGKEEPARKGSGGDEGQGERPAKRARRRTA
jgi:DNA end-binding protein Ku